MGRREWVWGLGQEVHAAGALGLHYSPPTPCCQAIHAARLAVNRLGGGEVAAAVGVDFLRTAEEHHHRAQMQLRIVSELATLTACPDGSPGSRLTEIARTLKRRTGWHERQR